MQGVLDFLHHAGGGLTGLLSALLGEHVHDLAVVLDDLHSAAEAHGGQRAGDQQELGHGQSDHAHGDACVHGYIHQDLVALADQDAGHIALIHQFLDLLHDAVGFHLQWLLSYMQPAFPAGTICNAIMA